MSDALARHIANHLLAQEGTGSVWELVIEEVRVGYARVRMTIRPAMANGHGTAHGGMIFSLADSAFAYACNSRNVATVAAGASILFLGPARIGEDLVAEAREDAVAGRSGSYTVAVRTAEGRAVAQFQGLSRSIGGALIDDEESENG